MGNLKRDMIWRSPLMQPEQSVGGSREFLKNIAGRLGAGLVYTATVTPGGQLRLCGSSEPLNASSRFYAAGGWREDVAAWRSIRSMRAVSASRETAGDGDLRSRFLSTWIGRLGYVHAIAAPIASPVWSGYPGAIVALRGIAQTDFNEADVASLDEMAKQLATDASAVERFGIVDGGGHFVRSSVQAMRIDASLATAMRGEIDRRLADPHNTSADRIALPDANGIHRPYRLVARADMPALGVGNHVMVCRVPDVSDWLSIKPEQFEADTEIQRLLPAIRFMFEQFPTGVTLPAISRSVFLSPFHFHRQFSDNLGITPKHFLYDCQIRRAIELLASPGVELESIVGNCGFAHQSHFTCRFRQATGITPSRWRKLIFRVDDETRSALMAS
jgi:AraC-like DNA-binding protein